MSSNQQSKDTSTKMTPEDAARIQSSNAKSGGDMSAQGFAARAQAAAAKNENDNKGTSSSGGGAKPGEPKSIFGGESGSKK